jgi:hypothetical protein
MCPTSPNIFPLKSCGRLSKGHAATQPQRVNGVQLSLRQLQLCSSQCLTMSCTINYQVLLVTGALLVLSKPSGRGSEVIHICYLLLLDIFHPLVLFKPNFEGHFE